MQTEPVEVLFSVADTGGGHRSAAQAISAALYQVSNGAVQSHVLDTFQAARVPLLRHSPTIYDSLSTRWLRVYNTGFRITNNRPCVELFTNLFDPRVRPRTEQLLQQMSPQLVVVTHPLTQRFISSARRKYQLPFRIVTVVTDLVSLHYSWLYKGVDLCLLPTDEAYRLMHRRGMPAGLMQRTGFPVHPKFIYYDRSQQDARQELHIDQERFTVLVTGGGVGSGRLYELVLLLEQTYPDHQFLVVTGKNGTLYEALRTTSRNPHTHIYGFVNNMETLMAASDVVVTKAGPGTLMEALVMRRPVIVTEAVGMQERGNIDFVRNHNLGFFCPTSAEIVGALAQLRIPEAYASTVTNLQDVVPRDGAIEIANILLEQMNQPLGPTGPQKVRRSRRRLRSAARAIIRR